MIHRLTITLVCLLLATVMAGKRQDEGQHGRHPRFSAKHYGSGQGVSYPGVNCLAQDADGFIWFGSNAGLTRFDGAHLHTFPMPEGNNDDGAFARQPRTMAADGDGRLWVGTKRGIFIFDTRRLLFTKLTDPLVPENWFVRRMALDPKHHCLLADGDGHAVGIDLKTQRVTALTEAELAQRWPRWSGEVDPDALSNIDFGGRHSNIRCALTDREGGLWMGSFFDGLFYCDTTGRGFIHIEAEERHNLIVRNIVRTDDGLLVVATENAGIFRLTDDGEGWQLQALDLGFQGRRLQRNIQSLTPDRDGHTLWIGTIEAGIYRCELLPAPRLTAHFSPADGTLADRRVACALQSADGTLWAGTLGGLFMLRPDGTKFETVEGVQEGFIHALAETADGSVWVGALDTPLRRLVPDKDGRWKVHEGGLAHSCVTSLHVMPDGTLLAGTDSRGVWKCVMNKSSRQGGLPTFEPTELSYDVLGSSVNTMLTDADGRLWVSTFNGLFCHDAEGGYTLHFAERDGLPTNFFNYASALLLSDTIAVWGTYQGLVASNPRSYTLSGERLHPFFTRIYAAGRYTTETDRVQLNYDAAELLIDFAVPVYRRAAAVWYRYRLRGGSSRAWILVQGGEQSIRLEHLPHGTYQLELQASFDPSRWDGDVATLHIDVHPPFWLTPWAWILYMILATCTVWAVIVIWLQRRERLKLRRQIERLLQNQELLRNAPQLSPYALIKDIAPTDRRNEWLERVDAFLESNLYNHSLGVDLVAEHMAMSNSTLYRRMKSVTSLSPNEYIRLFRLKRAAQMLRQEGMAIREVSDALCFSSVAYFTNCFSQQFGVTPGEYLKVKN